MFGGSFSYNQSNSKSQNGQNIWGPQAAGLTNLYGQGADLAANQQAGMGGVNDWFSQMQGGAMPAFQGLLQGAQNPWLQGMADTAMGSVARNFNSQIMPGLIGGANQAGQLGGSRSGLMQDFAGGEAMRAMGDVANNIYGNAWNSGLNAQQGALGMIPQMSNLGMGQMNAQWLPLMNQKQLLGQPTPLSWGNSKSSSYGTSGSFGLGMGMGGGG